MRRPGYGFENGAIGTIRVEKEARSGVTNSRACLGLQVGLEPILFGAVMRQPAPNFQIERRWLAGTQLVEPLSGDVIGKSVQGEHPDVDGVSFTGARVLDEITPTSGAVMVGC
jgi:hypothetical protein